MKTKTGIYAAALVAGLFSLAGCSLDEKKLTVCYADENGTECPDGMTELDASGKLKLIPYAGDLGASIAAAKQTCVAYSSADYECEGYRHVEIDWIKSSDNNQTNKE